MKKIITILIVIFISFTINAQRASLVHDTASYNGNIYTIGDTIKLATGSQQNKSFAFVNIGTEQSALTELDKTYANAKAIVEKIYIYRKSLFVNAKLLDKAMKPTETIILIDLEAAIDNEEIK